MTHGFTAMTAAFALARQPGPMAESPALLRHADQGPSADEATAADDDALIAVLEGDFLAIRQARVVWPTEAEMAEWAALLRWLIAALKGWSQASDPGCRRLRALLALTIYINEAGDPWPDLAADLVGSTELEQGLASLVGGFRIDVGIPETARDSEREILAAFCAADEVQAWDRVQPILRAIMPAFRRPFLRMQASRALSFLNVAALAQATARVQTLLTAISLVEALALECALALGALTTNDRLRFAIVDRHLAGRRLDLPPHLASSTVALLLSVGADSARWAMWMRMLFRSPAAYPPIRHPVGLALGQLPAHAALAFLDALRPEEHPESRWSAAAVFHAYAGVADLQRRRVVWDAVFDRWRAWEFGGGSVQGPARSTLDYAVVGHLVEGLPASEFRAVRGAHRAASVAAETSWYASRSAALQRRHSLASARLLYIWAWIVQRSGRPWLDVTSPRTPLSFRSAYRDLRYGTR